MSAPTANWSYPTAIRFGPGRIKELADACRAAGIERPLLVVCSPHAPGARRMPLAGSPLPGAARTRCLDFRPRQCRVTVIIRRGIQAGLAPLNRPLALGRSHHRGFHSFRTQPSDLCVASAHDGPIQQRDRQRAAANSLTRRSFSKVLPTGLLRSEALSFYQRFEGFFLSVPGEAQEVCF
jgi:hypothetical protein